MTKECRNCKCAKDISEFPKKLSGKYGVDGRCKVCKYAADKQWVLKNLARKRLTDRIYAQNNSERLRNNKLIWKYKITLDVYNKLNKMQQGKCLICQQTPRLLHVDHCHKTGDIRGLLCSACNVGLGYFRDNVDNLKAAMLYLTRGNDETPRVNT